MHKKFLLSFLISCVFIGANAQFDGAYASYKQDGEFGAAIGLDHYFGDLNTNASLSHPKFSAGIYFLKQFNNYIGVKVAGTYAFLAYADKYSNNEAQKIRNLSFNTDIWEFSISGVFNFFKFVPSEPGYRFTPYISLGAGVFSYDPYAYLNGTKYFLRPLGTEGQGSSEYPNRKPYGSMAVCFPLAVGVKQAITDKMNVFAEIGYRFTTTDYIDDVSTTYAGATAFPPLPNGQPSVAYQLQDRSGQIVATPIGIAGRQRGNSSQNDAYVIFHVGLSFNLSSYKCPTATQ